MDGGNKLERTRSRTHACMHSCTHLYYIHKLTTHIIFSQSLSLSLSLSRAQTTTTTTLAHTQQLKVVGTSAVVVLSIDPDASHLTSAPLGAFMVGSSAVSLWTLSCNNRRSRSRSSSNSRKQGFLWGIAFGAIGSALGVLSIVVGNNKEKSSSWGVALLIVATFAFGMATGIGFVWRFAAVEMVPAHWAARAVTLVVSGGCLAAFVGPESARATKDLFGQQQQQEHLGVFVMTGVFTAANFIFTMLVQFPKSNNDDAAINKATDTKNTSNVDLDVISDEPPTPTLGSLLLTRHFCIPMLTASLAWSLMGLPMSLVRVAMAQADFSSRQSLTVIELHFLGMYMPGFFTGHLIQAMTARNVCRMAAGIFAVALICLLLAGENEENVSIALWMSGLILVGIGWNWGFTGATVWLTAVYQRDPRAVKWKRQVQASNDGSMFLVAGAWTVSASYIFKAGGRGLNGWQVLNWVVVGLLGVYVLVLLIDFVLERQEQKRQNNKDERQQKNESNGDTV